MARILVYLDTKEGLEEKITLHWRRFTHIQILDDERVPFWCRRCHKVGHLYKEFPLVISVASPSKATVDAVPAAPSSAEG